MAKKQKKDNPEGTFIPACLLIGIGIGLFTGNVAAWTMVGLGVGFLLMVLTQLSRKKK